MFMLTKMGIEPIKHPASAIFLCVCVCVRGSVAEQLGCWTSNQQKKKEADLYSAFIEVPYTQGAQVWITQCYLQVQGRLTADIYISSPARCCVQRPRMLFAGCGDRFFLYLARRPDRWKS